MARGVSQDHGDGVTLPPPFSSASHVSTIEFAWDARKPDAIWIDDGDRRMQPDGRSHGMCPSRAASARGVQLGGLCHVQDSIGSNRWGCSSGFDVRLRSRCENRISGGFQTRVRSDLGLGSRRSGNMARLQARCASSAHQRPRCVRGAAPRDPRNWDTYAEDTLVIDIVDPSSGQLLWSGSGVGNTRGMGDDSDRMRGVKEAVRHIMRDLE